MNSALLESVKGDNINKVKECIQKGADIHYKNDHALRSAFYNGHMDIFKYLLSKNADINANNNEIMNMASNRYGDIETFEYLIENGMNVDKNALLNAIRNGDMKMIKYLVEEYKHLNVYGNSILLEIIGNPREYDIKPLNNNNKEMVEFLFKNIINIESEKALYLLTNFIFQNSYYDVLDIIKNIVNKNVKCIENIKQILIRINRFFICGKYNKCTNLLEIIEYLLNSIEDVHFNNEYINDVILCDNIDIFHIIVKKENECNKDITVLNKYYIYAIDKKSIKIARYLVEIGSDINSVDYKTRVKSGYYDAIKIRENNL